MIASHLSGGSAGPVRTCIVTGEEAAPERMIRFVVGPDGVVPDLKRKLPGRGVWVTADKAVLAEAVARKAFARSFKRDVKVAADLADRVGLPAARIRWPRYPSHSRR